jgi:hypothetical protein
LEQQLLALGDIIQTADADAAEDALKEAGSAFGSIAGANEVSSDLSKARRVLRRGDIDAALGEWRNAVASYEQQAAWREAANSQLRPGLEAYLDATADTIGARQQDRLSREQALFLAGCSADHRDLSLFF